MAETYTIDSQADWETGEFTDCHAVDPVGKLTPGVSPETLAKLVADDGLAVYLRCREGAGTTIENAANASYPGTLADASAWRERPDGRHYLHGSSISVPYFSGMTYTDDNDHSWSYAAQIRVRFSAFSAQILMQRANRFQLGVDASGYPYLINHYHISEVDNETHTVDSLDQGKWIYLNHAQITESTFHLDTPTDRTYELDAANGKLRFTSGGTYSGDIVVDYYHHEASGWTAEADCKANNPLTLNEWHTVGAICASGYLSLYVDGSLVASLRTDYTDNDPGTDLIAGCTDDWEGVVLSSHPSTACLVTYPSGGSWEKVYTLVGTRTLRRIIIWTGLDLKEQSVNVTLRFANAEADVDYAPAWGWSLKSSGEIQLYPPQTGLYVGTYMKLSIRLSESDYDRSAILVDKIVIEVREPAPIITEYVESPYGPKLLWTEPITPENLAGLISQVRELHVKTNELTREIQDIRQAPPIRMPTPGMGAAYGAPGASPVRTVSTQNTEPPPFEILPVSLETRVNILESNDTWHLGMIRTLQSDLARAFDWIASDGNALYSHISKTANVHGIADTSVLATSDDLASHAAATTGVHGVGTSTIASAADIDGHNADVYAHMVAGTQINDHINASSGVHGVGATYVAGQDYVDNAVANHAAATTGIHGVGASYIASTADIDNHAAATTGIHGVGSSYIASTADVVDAKNYADTAVANHAALDSGVHGVGSHYVAFSDQNTDTVEQQINTHAGLTTNVHGVGSYYIAKSNTAPAYADTVETQISNHANLNTGVHGVGSDYVAHSGYTQSTEEYIAAHENRCTNYAT